MDEKKLIEGIETTGYGLEYSVSTELQSQGWTVINNKYYIDDVQGVAREIDIVAYKVKLEKNVFIYTVLVISCKKSKENAWAFLSKEKPSSDPNIDWNPVVCWSNHKILKFMLENSNWKDSYVKGDEVLYKSVFNPERHVFAFQELNQVTGKAQNDKAIFNSVISLMKAQSYEINLLEERKKQHCFYNFNLISVVDAPLVRASYSEDGLSIEEINSEMYIANNIVNGREVSSRVHFIVFKYFSKCLSYYDKLHKYNVRQTFAIYNSFFDDCVKDRRKMNLLKDEFAIFVGHEIERHIGGGYKDIDIGWNQEKNSLFLMIGGLYDQREVDELNSDSNIHDLVSFYLKDIYKYEGKFNFEVDIPF